MIKPEIGKWYDYGHWGCRITGQCVEANGGRIVLANGEFEIYWRDAVNLKLSKFQDQEVKCI
jgi:hypothetical protein